MPRGAALTRKNIAGKHALPAERLDAKALAARVASVARRSACFVVSHNVCP
jgi:hypothetical protein